MTSLLQLLQLLLFLSILPASNSSSLSSIKKAVIAGSVTLAGFLIVQSSQPVVFRTADDIPTSFFREHKEISGTVVKVIDGDTYRVMHQPSSSWLFPSQDGKNKNSNGNGKKKEALSTSTISVRIVAVDTPEVPKYGEKGQKYGLVAKDFVTKRILNERVTLKLWTKDQYGRVLASVRYNDGITPFFSSSKDIAEELLKAGLAVVYRQRGAEYGKKGRDFWETLEARAKKEKTGLWSESAVDLPSAYKSRQRMKASSKI